MSVIYTTPTTSENDFLPAQRRRSRIPPRGRAPQDHYTDLRKAAFPENRDSRTSQKICLNAGSALKYFAFFCFHKITSDELSYTSVCIIGNIPYHNSSSTDL